MQILLLPIILGLTAVLASAADFGSCPQDQRCDFMCCGEGEACMRNYCIGNEFVSTAIMADAATSLYPSLADDEFLSSVLSVMDEPGGLQSVYDQFVKVMTNAPSPSALGTEVPSGFTVPSILSPPPTATATASSSSPQETGSAAAVPTGAAPRQGVGLAAVVVGVLGAVALL